MPNNDAELRIGGDSSGLVDAMKTAERSVKESFDRMNASMASVGSALQKLQGAFIAVTAVIAGGKAFKEVMSASNDWALESGKLAKALGVTVEQASVMKVALNHIGVESDVMVAASMKMSKQIFANGTAFEAMGIKVKDASGNYRPAMDVMMEAGEKLKSITNPIAQNIAGMQLFGKSWADAKVMLKLTSEVMAEAEARAKQLGLVVSSIGVESAKQYKMQLNDLSLVSKSLEVQMGNQLTPVFVRLGQWMGNEAPAMGKVFATVLESIGFVAQSVWLGLKDMGDGLGAIGAQAAALLHGDLAAFREIGRLRDEEAAKNQAAYEKLIANYGKEIPAAKSKAPEMGGETPDFSKTPKTDTRYQVWKSTLEQMKEVEGSFFKSSMETEEAYWQQKLSLVKGNSAHDVQLRRQIQHEIYSIHKQQAEQDRQIDNEAISQRQKLGKVELDGEREKLRLRREMGEINETEELQALTVLLNQEYQIELSALQDKMKLYDQDKLAKQKTLNEIEILERQHSKAVEKINNDTLISQKKSTEQMLSPITSAISKSVTGMIQGTLTLKKALSNLFQSILGEFVSLGARMVASWAATELTKTGLVKSGSLLRLALEKAGLIEETAAKVTATTAEVATNEVAAQSGAGLAAVLAMASVAAIPFIGWAMAPGVGAETYAVAEGFAASAAASGGYDIPSGVNPVTQLHQEEMVLPAHLANPLRESLANGGMGGDTHLHVSAVDGASVAKLFKDHGHIIAKELRRQSRNFAPKNV